MDFLKEYPKRFILKDGTEVEITPMKKEHRDLLLEFFRSLPETDRLYLRDDVTKEETIDKWIKNLNYERVLPLLVFSQNKIIADGTLHRSEYSWDSHVGEIRLVVHPSFRKKGVGMLVARELYSFAMRVGLEKIIARMMESQKTAITIFEKLGFKKEAVLKNHVKDAKGMKHNMVIMSNDVSRLFLKLKFLEEEVTRPTTEG